MSSVLLRGSDRVEEVRREGVPREYVHLHREESVLVTGWSSHGDDRYSVTARWPAAGDGTFHDTLLLTQTIRQSCLLIAHAERSVPLSHQTLMERMDFSLARSFCVPRNQPADLIVNVSCRNTGRRSMRMELALLHGQRVVAESVVDFSWIAPAVYRRLRGEYLHAPWGGLPVPAPVAAHTVGRTDALDVVLAAGDRPGRWNLRVDVRNRMLYDHPVDHVPALALIEAACQAAQGVTHPAPFSPVEVVSSYDHYVEFDAPCRIEAAVTPPAGDAGPLVEVKGVQYGRTAFTISLVGRV
ncbi:ScbA/BarX family gamma-butyrolactone biosynthesis protein [Streptomyces sp. NPDC085946]|uniref:ScbA/BarX family gamma-butyrolactone biosynthesis protein n=1 Tax=Streptomyces sp. NPDC085946 TaxID=3365744 RepID=UPI0037D05806